jgi:TIR domain
MRVFVSYAGEQRTDADRLALGLRQAGHRVFFDRDALGAGDDYDAAIRREVGKSSLFVYLVSRDSLRRGAYSLTELGYARKRWPTPSERVLPVMVEPVPIESIDAYLRAVSVLMPKGDLVAEVLGRVHAIASRRRRRLLMTAAAVLLVALGGAYGLAWSSFLFSAEHTVSGRVVDAVSGGEVPGTSVEVRRSGQVLNRALTDGEGRFTLTFNVGRKSLGADLVIAHEGYEPSSVSMTLTGDGVAPRQHNISLLASGLRECRLNSSSGVVVGHFQPPIGGTASPDGELAVRIMRTLTYDLLPRLQALNLSEDAKGPSFKACDEARPRSDDLGRRYAEALNADAFLTGNVKPASGNYDVRVLIADRFALFVRPLEALTRKVQLQDPAAARFDAQTHAAILTAIARGNRARGRYADCVEIISLATRMLGRDTDILAKTREDCQREAGLPRLEGS